MATQQSGGMPVNDKLSVIGFDNAGYEVSIEQTGWNRSAVRLDKRAILPTAAVVNRPRDQFLAHWHNSCTVRSWPGGRIGR
jgi:hypothetical protein